MNYVFLHDLRALYVRQYLTAEDAEETRRESYQFSVVSLQERQLLAFNPSPSMKGEAG